MRDFLVGRTYRKNWTGTGNRLPVKIFVKDLCGDAKGVQREKVHEEVSQKDQGFFDTNF
jgi:hypothetical protein